MGSSPIRATGKGLLFNNLSSTTYTKPGGFDSDGSNTKVSKVNGASTSTRLGPSIVLKVMAGDTISISSKAWYTGSTQAPPSGLSPIADQLLTLLSNGIVASGGTHGGAIPSTDINSALPDVLDAFFNDDQPYNSARPKAFLNWMIVDEEFKKTTSSFHMGAVQVPVITDSAKQLTGPANMVVRRNGWLYVYVSNESNQDVYFDDIVINHKRGPAVEMNNYYAFGLEIPGLNSKAIGFGTSPQNRLKYNGKELQSKEFSDGSGLEWEDYGARMYDPQIGRWMKGDNKAELYFATSPYVYALNQPTNAVDPDGNLVIFINGNFFGFSAPGKSYWQTTVYTIGGAGSPHSTILNPQGGYNAPRSFDGEVMDQLGDHNARYYDGSVGGNHPLVDNPYPTLGATAAGRELAGYSAGKHDAKTLIDNLARDKSGNITETIKIITHSMGGAYGKGFVIALKEYIKTLPIEVQKQIKITLDADFDPHQAGDIEADPDIKTTQYKHKNRWNIFGMGWLANEDEKGLGKDDIKTNTGTSTDHSIFTFFNDISSLEEGTYKWDGSKWVKQ